MKKIDINFMYRQCAIFCAVHGRKNEGKGHITWDSLKERFGVSWESYANELKVKGMLFGATGYYYLRPEWAVMTPAEQMEEISKMYPRGRENEG